MGAHAAFGPGHDHRRIAGWTVSLTDLRGLKVTAAQVLDLAGLLGVEIVS